MGEVLDMPLLLQGLFCSAANDMNMQRGFRLPQVAAKPPNLSSFVPYYNQLRLSALIIQLASSIVGAYSLPLLLQGRLGAQFVDPSVTLIMIKPL